MTSVEHVLDKVLETVSGFQTELGAITAQIQAIQSDTKLKEVKLENRKVRWNTLFFPHQIY